MSKEKWNDVIMLESNPGRNYRSIKYHFSQRLSFKNKLGKNKSYGATFWHTVWKNQV